MLRKVIQLALVKQYNQNDFHGIKMLHTTTQRIIEARTRAMETKHVNTINELLAKYTAEEEEKILKIINNYSLSELLGYKISQGRANKLLAWRVRNGLLKNLNDVLCVEGFSSKVCDKLFQSLLLEPKSNKLSLPKSQPRTSSFITPSLEAEQRKLIKSCVSVRIGVNSITWSRLDVPRQDINTPCSLTHWQHEEISEKRLHLNELIQRCLYVHHLIPTADCYIFENPQIAQASTNPGSVEQQNVNIQKAQVTAIMGYALASRNKLLNYVIDNESIYFPNIFYLRRFLSARLFNHLVGTETVSSERTILNMMRTYYNTNEESDDVQQTNHKNVNLSGRVQFPSDLREMFSKAPSYYREFLGGTLLLNLTFVHLVLLQDPDIVEKVSKGSKPKL